ncbi:MAG: response regulator [Thermoanaerobaculia bacterium]
MRRRQKVLIVEDNADLRRLFAIGLNQRGYEVRLAGNGAEAVDRVEAERPDVILLDLVMPIMDGWEVIDRVNSEGAPDCIPVVVVSAHGKPADRSIHACVRGWIVKPATLDQLAEAIRGATSRKPVKSATHGDGVISHP